MSSSWKEKSKILLAENPVYRLFRRVIVMPNGTEITRDVFEEGAAVAVVALDDSNRVALIEQYRVPLNRAILELPAGRVDDGESPLETMKRELREEADLKASLWFTLVDMWLSPGITNGRLRVYLATGLTEQPAYARTEEEAEMKLQWHSLRDAQMMVMEGGITNGPAVAGIMAAYHLVHGMGQPTSPRAAEAPWMLTPVA